MIEDNHTKRGKFKRGNVAALKLGFDDRTMLNHTASQRDRWKDALTIRNRTPKLKAEKPLRLQDWIREVLDAEAKRAVREGLR